ncbi:hypothetical protein CEK25_006657 [Fusarium fujikuroi]|nr:hypothetical protein CEK25_006657 [Fusarium fujikuroi]
MVHQLQPSHPPRRSGDTTATADFRLVTEPTVPDLQRWSRSSEMPGPTKFREYQKGLEALIEGRNTKQIKKSSSEGRQSFEKTGRCWRTWFPTARKPEEPDRGFRVQGRQAAE